MQNIYFRSFTVHSSSETSYLLNKQTGHILYGGRCAGRSNICAAKVYISWQETAARCIATDYRLGECRFMFPAQSLKLINNLRFLLGSQISKYQWIYIHCPSTWKQLCRTLSIWSITTNKQIFYMNCLFMIRYSLPFLFALVWYSLDFLFLNYPAYINVNKQNFCRNLQRGKVETDRGKWIAAFAERFSICLNTCLSIMSFPLFYQKYALQLQCKGSAKVLIIRTSKLASL